MIQDNSGAAAGAADTSPIGTENDQAIPSRSAVEPPDTRSQEERELLRWPYMIHALEDTLDADLIEGRGQQLLFQALNQKTAVAFVGSGLPMAYGRLSWKGLQAQQYRLVRTGAEEFLKCAKASTELIEKSIEMVRCLADGGSYVLTFGGADRDFKISGEDKELLVRFLQLKKKEIVFHREEVDKLFKTFGTLESEGHFIGGEGPPIVLQVAEKLQDVLSRSVGVFLKRRTDAEQGEPASDDVPSVKQARFGFLEDSDVSPAPAKLLDEIAAAPDFLIENPDRGAESLATSIRRANGAEVGQKLIVVLVAFQKAFEAYQKALTRYDHVMRAREARLSLETITKMLLVDECAHAEQILRNSVDYSTTAGRKAWALGKFGAGRRDAARRKALNRKLRGMDAAASTDNLRRDIRGIRDEPRRYRSLAFFKTESFIKLKNALHKKISKGRLDTSNPWIDITTLLGDQLLENNRNDHGTRREVKRVFVSPTHRFVFQMMMAFFEDPYRELHLDIEGANDRRLSLIPDEVRATDFQSRQSIIDAELDPLDIIAMRLGVSRFLTTNYDLEIERFYQDRGYRRFTADIADGKDAVTYGVRHRGPDVYRVDGIGGTLRDQTFRRENATDLIGFSLDEASADAHVFHLHGSATDDSTIVATERDYMDLYLQQDMHRETVDESIRIAFAANPLIFLGLGMQEADVLRPLRQFMSDKDRAVGRTAIVLLPGTGSRNDQSKDAATIYLRYGAHTIHYGWAEIDVCGSKVGLDWLHHIDKLIGALKASNRQMRDTLVAALKTAMQRANKKADSYDIDLSSDEKKMKARSGNEYEKEETLELFITPQQRLDRIARILGKIERPKVSLPERESEKDVSFLALLAGKDHSKIEASQMGVSMALPQFRSRLPPSTDVARETTAGPAPLEFECGLLAQILRVTVRNRPLKDYQIPYVKNLLKDDDSTLSCWDWEAVLRRHIRELNARIVALEGLPNAIITGALCASLASLERQWQDWWRDWQLSPPHRTARFATHEPRFQEGKVYLPRRYTRHRLINDITDLSAQDWAGPQEGETADDQSERERRNSDTLVDVGSTVGDKTYPNGSLTGVLSFDTFLDAVETRRRVDHGKTWDRGRRWYCITAPRGTGRGAFLSAFQTSRGLGQYIASAWPHDGSPFDPLYVSAIFINLSFSTEIASTLDMLREALLDTVAALEFFTNCAADRVVSTQDLFAILNNATGPASASGTAAPDDGRRMAEARKELSDKLKPLSRLRRLERLFEYFRLRAEAVAAIWMKGRRRVYPRLLLCITGVEMLHYAGGLPKNREIEELLTLLTKKVMRQTPYDLVLVTNEDNLGEILVENTPFFARYRSVIKEYEPELDVPSEAERRGLESAADKTVFVPIARGSLPWDEAASQTVERRMQSSGIAFASRSHSAACRTGMKIRYGSIVPNRGDTDDKREANALPVADAQPIELPRHLKPSDVCYVHLARVAKPVDVLVDNFRPLAALFWLYYKGNSSEKSAELIKRNSREIVYNFRIPSKKYGDEKPAKIWSMIDVSAEDSSLEDAWKEPSPRECLAAHIQIKERRLARVHAILTDVTGTGDVHKHRKMLVEPFNDQSDNAHVFREWRGIRTILNSNRYCLTILLAAAQRHALSGRDVTDGVQRAQTFIRKTIDHVKAVSVSKREETVLHDVLDAYDAFHVIGEPHNDCELHLLILRHLAVIGAPCSADILVRTPQILDYFDKLPEGRERSRNLRVMQALTVLAERGLIFRLEPHPRLSELYRQCANDKEREAYFEQGADPVHTYRYGLHRLMQRHILQKMGSGPREFAEINSLAPSVYASMPADLPRLNQESYQFMRELVDSLSQYPDRGGRDRAGQRWHFGEAAHTTRVQALRCALSLVRSTFSVAVVSRFEGIDAGRSKPPRGYFEAYRVQVRWLIRKAWEIFEKDGINPLNYSPEDAAKTQLAAFYRDEIVWLYNECGVICLVQGNLRDAASLLRQAIHFNREIEGLRDGGPQYNHLSLNLAVTQIERGRLESAFTRLQAICESERRYSSRPGRIWHIAHGYLGLVQHLRGDLDDAERRYTRAIRVLRVYDDSRACSIFSKHLGDLERMRGRTDEARMHIESAISFAQAGGHEDLHKRARLSLILVDIATRTKRDFSIRSTLAQLQLIEDYAETMEMPSLLSDVLTVRARLLLEQGESTLAGSLLSRAMVMAKRNGMNLRLNSAMTNYARVLAMRGLKDQANKLLFTCLDIAKRNNNQIEIARAESAFDELHLISRVQERPQN
ncbi:SIR2 family protein [Aquibium sp. ELW1220]|uniref:SIR2 family protein n=1 Tax=Aquibium sp. ELW1220 TaxID=2976766 RepID=UPI0025B0D55C|nr:SIR2 family protein [Aquibium sp. ELW1220]MDN2579025.1 SIR2 family protein [Aquibium sp. ELW1220]